MYDNYIISCIIVAFYIVSWWWWWKRGYKEGHKKGFDDGVINCKATIKLKEEEAIQMARLEKRDES